MVSVIAYSLTETQVQRLEGVWVVYLTQVAQIAKSIMEDIRRELLRQGWFLSNSV